MARIFQTVVKKITTVVSGGVNATAVQRVGLRLTNRLSALLATVRAGVRVSQGPTSLTITQRPALRLTSRVDSGLVTITQRPALRLSNVLTAPTTVQKPAVNITQVTYNLVSDKGADTVTESAVGGRTDWASDSNASGVNNSTMATFAAAATGARGGRLDLAYANYLNKTELTITKVELRFYGRVFNTVLNDADVRLQYNIGAGDVTLETITGDADYRSTPKTHDITSAIGGDWSKLDAITTHCRANAALGETWQAELDAVVVHVEANRTDTL